MKKQLSATVLAALSERLTPEGFKLVKSREWFVRTSPGRRDVFALVMLDAKPGCRVCPGMGVRFEAVEEIFHRASGFERQYQKGTSTVGLDLRHTPGGEEYRLPVLEQQDVPGAVDRLAEIFHEKALPYFAQFPDLQAVDAAINGRPEVKCVHRSLEFFRCCTGLIVAKLTGRKNLDELASIYRRQMELACDGFYLPYYEALLRELELS